MDDEIRSKIETIPGAQGWWTSDGSETFEQVADQLLALGMSVDDVLGMLHKLYYAVAAEFGN